MKNQLLNHLATKQIFACDYKQISQAISASLDDIEREDFFQLRPTAAIVDGVGVIHIQGLLTNDVPAIYEKAGIVTTYDTIKKEIEGALLGGAGAIQLNINSGGGSVNGAIELSRWIASLPVSTIAFVTSCACSAAYMLAAACDSITATETAMVGNIGTIMTWTDYTAMDERMGVEEKALTNEGATLKSTFHIEPNEEQLAFLQETLDHHGQSFGNFIISQREVDSEVFRAGWYSGQKALDLGLIDNLTEI
jgi:protease-4